MPSVREVLRATGIWPASDDDAPALLVGFAGLARPLRERLVRTVGLLPAGDDVAVPAVALQLGRALADRSAGLVGVIDARGTWPCARALVDGASAQDGALLATSWLLPRLAVLTARAPDAGAALDQLRSVVALEATSFDHLVVDLTGFDHLGDQIAACELLEAAVLVARSGRTTRREIQGWFRDLPDRPLRVLLTGL